MVGNKNTNETPPFFQIPKILNEHPDITNDHLIIFMHLYDQLRQRTEWNIPNPELCILARVSLPTLKRKLNDLESWGYLDRKGMGHNRKFMLGLKFNNRSNSEPETKLNNRSTSEPVLAHQFTSTGSHVYYIDKNSNKNNNNNKNNININTRETEISPPDSTSQKISRTPSSEMLQLPPPKINEDENMNTRFENGYHVGPFDAYRHEQEKQQPTIAEQINHNQLAVRQQYNLTEIHEAEFDVFWGLYPSKKNKERIRTMWYAQGCHLISTTIIRKLIRQTEEDAHFLDGYHPSAYNYLRDRRWEDEIEVRKKKGTFDHNDGSWANSDRKSIFE